LHKVNAGKKLNVGGARVIESSTNKKKKINASASHIGPATKVVARSLKKINTKFKKKKITTRVKKIKKYPKIFIKDYNLLK